MREYSIASAPRADGRIELSVERLPDGEVSPYLTSDLAIGDVVDLRGPIGRWFVWRVDQTEPIQLIASGSGIVPLMSMIRSRLAARSDAPFRLLYSVRNPASVWYRDEHDRPLEHARHYGRRVPVLGQRDVYEATRDWPLATM